MQKALVIGSTGLLGSRVSRIISTQYELLCTFHKNSALPGFNSINLPITNYFELDLLFSLHRFDLVINCAGLTSVEDCESRPEAAWQLNATLPYHLSVLTQKYNARFIHISTDHFLSEYNSPRNEDVNMVPVNQYGHSKLAGEKFVLEFNKSATIVRTNFFGLSSSGSHSLLNFLVSKLSKNEKILGFQDVYFSPLGVSELASIIIKIAISDIKGIINAVGFETVSKFEFAKLVASELGKKEGLVSPGSVTSLGSAVARPNYLALNARKLTETLKIELPSIKSMLEVELRNAI